MDIKKEKPPGYYKFGLYYFEQGNKNLLVKSPKTGRFTINFFNKWAYVVAVLLHGLLLYMILTVLGVIR
jgi:uncharacterized membrane protein